MTLLLYYFDANLLEHPVEEEAVRRLTRALVTTWEDRVSAILEKSFGEREGRRLFERYVRSETRSGIYRESTPPEEVPDDLTHLETLEGRLVTAVVPRTSEMVSLKLYSVRPLGLTDTLRTLQNLGLSRHRGASDHPGAPRGPEGVSLPVRHRGSPGPHRVTSVGR